MLQAMWVHGNTVVPERTIKAEPAGTDGPLTDIRGVPGSGMLGFRRGGGTQFRGKDGHKNWFHFSIPTPVIHNGERANLAKVFVLYRTDPQVNLIAVHVWDGARTGNPIFQSAMPRGISGDHDGSGGDGDLIEGMNMWTVSAQPRVFWGVGISVHVHFIDTGNIIFASAGADFDVTPGQG